MHNDLIEPPFWLTAGSVLLAVLSLMYHFKDPEADTSQPHPGHVAVLDACNGGSEKVAGLLVIGASNYLSRAL